MSKTVKTIELSGNQELVVRQPAVEADLVRLVKFFSDLPAEIRNYLRYDVTDVKFCRARLQQIDGKDHWRLIAELDGKIVGDATLDREPFGWTRHVAELRGVIDPKHQDRGIGLILFNELVAIGAKSGIELLFTEVMREQADLIATLDQAGFVQESVRKQYAKDLNGKLHDVIIMSNNLESVWKHLAELLEEMDIQPFRGA